RAAAHVARGGGRACRPRERGGGRRYRPHAPCRRAARAGRGRVLRFRAARRTAARRRADGVSRRHRRAALGERRARGAAGARAGAAMTSLLYTLLLRLALPMVLARLWWRGRREPGYRLGVAERLGRYAHAQPERLV